MHREERREVETPVHYPCNYEESYVPVPIAVKHSVQQVNADRRDVNQKSKAINWRGRARTFSGQKRETRILLARVREGKTSRFSRRARGDPDPRARCLECVRLFSFF